MQIIKYIRKYKNIITVFTVMFVIIGLIFIKNNLNKDRYMEVQNDMTLMSYVEDDDKTNNSCDVVSGLKVDVKGAIVNPGVYEGDSNTRIIDIINMAGGLTDDANTNVINLAKKISDDMVIIIYTNNQVDNILNNEEVEDYKIIETEDEKIFPDVKNDALIEEENQDIDNDTSNNCDNTSSESTSSTNQDIIDINKATVSDFDSLPGIGESKAKTIIEYRETNGLFESIEDIKNVSGIGDALFDKIKAYIKV